MSVVQQQLIEMGYSAESAELAAGNNRTVDQAINYIIENDGVIPPTLAQNEEDNNAAVKAASYECNDCGKIVANDEEMMRHASATKHTNFSVSEKKQLSVEEKAEQLAEICRKLKVAKEAKAEAAVTEEKEAETERRSNGQAMASYREEAREREIREAARLRTLQKVEDEVAKKRVLEQIRLDREERRAKTAGYVAPVVPVEKVVPPPKKDYTTTMIQFRLLDGQTVKQEFKVDEPLMMLRGWIESNFAKGTPFTLMTAFPRKVFTEEDMGTPLNALNLVPTASIVLLNRAV